MVEREKERLDVSAEITKLRDRYEFQLVKIAKYVGAKASAVGRWQGGRLQLPDSAPKAIGCKIQQLLQIAELIETEGGILARFVAMQLQTARVDGVHITDLFPDNYPLALQRVRQYCQESL